MRKGFITGILLVVMLIVFLHNAIPHHHHAHGGKGHSPVNCLIQSTYFEVPRSISHGKSAIPNTTLQPFGIPVIHDQLIDEWICISWTPSPSHIKTDRGKPIDLPARAPPLLIFL